MNTTRWAYHSHGDGTFARKERATVTQDVALSLTAVSRRKKSCRGCMGSANTIRLHWMALSAVTQLQVATFVGIGVASAHTPVAVG